MFFVNASSTRRYAATAGSLILRSYDLKNVHSHSQPVCTCALRKERDYGEKARIRTKASSDQTVEAAGTQQK